MRTKRVLAAIAATVCFAIPISFDLLRRPTSDRVETPFIYEKLAYELEPKTEPFVREAHLDGDQRLLEMSLFTPMPLDVMRQSEIGIMFWVQAWKDSHPAVARLEFAGTTCIFETYPNAFIGDGKITKFRRGDRCVVDTTRPTGEITLTLRTVGRDPLGVHTRVLSPQLAVDPVLRPSGLIYAADAGEFVPASPPPVLLGSYTYEYSHHNFRRGNLLAFMWTGNTALGPIVAVIAAAATLIAIGVMTFPTRVNDASWRFALEAGVAAGSFAAALALTHAMVTPPLHAADETAFARSYGELTNQPELLPQFQQLALQNHFQRIKGNQFEKFRPRDVVEPLNYVHKFEQLDMPARSSTSTHLWRALATTTRGEPARELFAVVRLLHVLIFAAAVAVASALMTWMTEVRYPQLLCFPLFVIPTLPFFGMQFSETALLTSGAVILAASVVIVALDGRRACWAGFPFGFGAAAIWLSTRSSLPMASLVLSVAAGRVLLSRSADSSIKTAAIFWGGVAAAGMLFFNLITVPHLARIIDMAAVGNGRLGDNSLSVPDWLLLNPWLIVAAAAAVSMGAEILARRIRILLPERNAAAQVVAALLAYLLIAGIATSLVASWWLDFPDVTNIESPFGPDTWTYAREIVVGVLTMFRLRGSSTFLSDSLWNGFGWLDTIPPDPFTATLVVITGAALSMLLWHIARFQKVRAAVWMVLLGAGAIGSLVFYAFAAKQVNTNIHGRFLLPWFIVMVSLAWIWPASQRPARGWIPVSRFALLLALAMGIHLYALHFIIERFF